MSDERQMLMEVFSVEAREHLDSMARELIALEQETSPEGKKPRVETLFRNAHSLKGAARAVGLEGVERLSHGMENVLNRIRTGETEVSGELVDLLLEASDRLAGLINSALKGETDSPPPEELIGRLDSPLSAPEQTGEPEPGEPPAEPAGEKPSRMDLPSIYEPIHSSLVRVATDRLDRLIHLSGTLSGTFSHSERIRGRIRDLSGTLSELERGMRRGRNGNTRGELARLARETERTGTLLWRYQVQTSLLLRELQNEIQAARLLPVAELQTTAQRVIRDGARQTGKSVRLVFQGGETRLDRNILEEIRDPLIHLLRNAVDHGLEEPEEREDRGKPEEGVVEIRAEQKNDLVELTIRDDGRGLDPERLREKAVSLGWFSEKEARGLETARLEQLIFRSGFSTRSSVSALSGRGVGLDAVRDTIKKLQGKISVRSAPGQWTEFRLVLPVTAATLRVLEVRAGGSEYLIPSPYIERTDRYEKERMRRIGGSAALEIEGETLPLVALAALLDGTELPGEPDKPVPLLVIADPVRKIALTVDELLGEREVILRPLPPPLKEAPFLSGGTLFSDGSVALILDVPSLMEEAGRLLERGRESAPSPREPSEGPPRILVVDDSRVERAARRTVLQEAGFRVIEAADGKQAWEKISGGGVDAVCTDLCMPEQDGAWLVKRIRNHPFAPPLPVVIISSLSEGEKREEAEKAGPDGYLVKGKFEAEELVQTLHRLLESRKS